MGLSNAGYLMDDPPTGPRVDRVLVVNDSPEQLEFTAEVLREAAFHVLVARDGIEGIEIARRERPDVIISDVVMPRLDGFELCRAIRGIPDLRTTPVLLVTGLATDSESAVAGLKAGADDYLELPFDPMRLVSRVARLVERRRTEELLQRSEQRFRLITDTIQDVFWMRSPRVGRMVYISPGYRTLWGRSLTSVYEDARSFVEAIHPDDRDRVAALLDTHCQSAFECEYRVMHPDGSLRWIRDRGYPVTDDEGEVIFTTGVASDITELQQHRQMLERANESLERSERRYRDLVENLNDVVYSIDADGRVVYVSRAIQRYGYSSEQLAGRHFAVLIHPDDVSGVEHSFARARDGLVDPHEFRVLDRYGAVHRVRASSRSVFDGERYIGITGVVMDVTEQRRAEEQLRVAQRLEAVGRLAGGVAHDFNNLLVAINGYAEFALDAVREGDPMRKDLEEILKAGNRAAGLTRQLLAFSRKQVLQPEIINLNEVVDGMEAMLRRLIGEDIEFRTALGDDVGRILADPGQIEQVIMNLVVNARDAMPTGGRLVIETSTRVADDDDPTTREWVVAAVSDTGYGMDDQTKAQIFEPFFSTKAVGEGTGLGLSTVHGIVNQSGGTIVVDSTPGKGTTFTVAFPRVSAPCPKAPLAVAVEPAQGRETILIVEDEPAVRQLTRRFLSSAGYRVLTAENGGSALLTCESYEGPIDLLLTDVIMPQMSGTALWQRLGKLRPEMRVLYMSGYSGSAIAHHGVLDEGTPLLQKPFSSAQLARRVREVLEKPAGAESDRAAN